MLHGGFSYCVVGKTLLVIWIMPNGEHGEMFDRTPNKSRIKTKTEREMFKCSNVHWHHFSTCRRVHYYIRDTPPNGATNTGNININYDEGVMVVNNLKFNDTP